MHCLYQKYSSNIMLWMPAILMLTEENWLKWLLAEMALAEKAVGPNGIGQNGTGQSGSWPKWIMAKMGFGLNGSWPKWHWPKWLLAKLGIGPSGVGRNGIGRNGFGWSGNNPIDRMGFYIKVIYLCLFETLYCVNCPLQTSALFLFFFLFF